MRIQEKMRMEQQRKGVPSSTPNRGMPELSRQMLLSVYSCRTPRSTANRQFIGSNLSQSLFKMLRYLVERIVPFQTLSCRQLMKKQLFIIYIANERETHPKRDQRTPPNCVSLCLFWSCVVCVMSGFESGVLHILGSSALHQATPQPLAVTLNCWSVNKETLLSNGWHYCYFHLSVMS